MRYFYSYEHLILIGIYPFQRSSFLPVFLGFCLGSFSSYLLVTNSISPCWSENIVTLFPVLKDNFPGLKFSLGLPSLIDSSGKFDECLIQGLGVCQAPELQWWPKQELPLLSKKTREECVRQGTGGAKALWPEATEKRSVWLRYREQELEWWAAPGPYGTSGDHGEEECFALVLRGAVRLLREDEAYLDLEGWMW